MGRARFNTRMEINVDRTERLIVELIKEGDFLEFKDSEERVEFIGNDKLITIGIGEKGRGWYANSYSFQYNVIIPKVVDKKRFRSKKVVFNYCEEQRQGRN